jgi:hypothetical protein
MVALLNTAAKAILKVSRQRGQIALLASMNWALAGRISAQWEIHTGGNHDDCRISVCDRFGRLDCVGRVGGIDAGKLSG